MSDYGIKIKNFAASPLYAYNMGLREHTDATDAMICNSLFLDFLKNNGLKINNGEWTRDIICMSFNFGTRSYEAEMEHLTNIYEKADEEKKQRIQKHIDKCENNRERFEKLSKDEIRRKMYNEGTDVHWKTKDGTETIHYRMLYRNPSKAKSGQVMFIREELYEKAHEWLTMGVKLPDKKAKIVEMSAYSPLSTSTIVDKFHLEVGNVLIVNDQDSFFKTLTDVVSAEDYIKKDGTEGKKCVVHREEMEVKNTLWDGMALIDVDACPESVNGMALLRNHFFKACAFKTRIQKFFKDWCKKNGKSYRTYQVEDMFGNKHYLKDIQMITTNNAVKWLKFVDYMGGTKKKAYDYWCDRIKADGEMWGIVKTDHVSKLGNVQQMSYQMVNTLPVDKAETHQIASESIAYVERLKSDPEAFCEYLKKNANNFNHYKLLADLYEHYPTFKDAIWFREEKKYIINSYVHKLRNGKITVEGDNLTLCGNPYALLMYVVGEDWEDDSALNYEEGCIQCYTPRFEDGEYLCAIRSPNNSSNNIGYMHNRHSELMKKYFLFTNNIMAVNCIHSDVQPRFNGEDFDSDFNFVTNNPVMVKAAKECYENFPTVVNALNESGVTYDNTMDEYARLDSKMAHSQRAIGESSNIAQKCVSYYWSELMSGVPDKKKLQVYYDCFVILAVLAQVAIDSTKREYEVNVSDEIARIKKIPELDIYEIDEEGKKHKKDFPYFMKFTRGISVTDGKGNYLNGDKIKEGRSKVSDRINYKIQCPMNYLQESLNGIRKYNNSRMYQMDEYIREVDELPDIPKASKILDTVKKYANSVKQIATCMKDADPDLNYEKIIELTDDVIAEINGMKIGKGTMNYLIKSVFCIPFGKDTTDMSMKAKRVKRKMLNTLYKCNPKAFLANFKDREIMS